MPESPLNDFPRSAGAASDAAADIPNRVPATPPPRQSGFLAGLSALWTLIFRLMVLGVGVSLAWLVGAALAQVLPSPSPQKPPLQEIVQRRVSRLSRKVQQLPRWWSEDLVRDGEDGSVAAPQELTQPTAPVATPPIAPAAANLNGPEREAAQAEISALETELDALDNRLADLETKLGQPVSDAPLESRLQRLSRTFTAEQANPEASSPASTPTAAAPSSPAPSNSTPAIAAEEADPLFQLARDRVTLPSALLFAPGQSLLTPDAERILDTLLSDLGRYPGATLVVGSHSDGPETADAYRSLTFKQALSVEQYLASRLGEDYRWVVVGYGRTRPLVEGTSQADQQRNQRIEISIVPQQ